LNAKRDRTRNLHYSRNNYNTHNITVETQISWSTNWIKSSKMKSALHQIDVPEDKWNSKYVDITWKKEIIFDYESWRIVTDEKNIWTYNFYAAIWEDKASWLHKKYDVDPYVEWWNWWNDLSNKDQRSCWTRSCVVKNTK